jgi:hypothetical protein
MKPYKETSHSVNTTTELTPKRYRGEICLKHPHYKGLRFKRNHKCVQCIHEEKCADALYKWNRRDK